MFGTRSESVFVCLVSLALVSCAHEEASRNTEKDAAAPDAGGNSAAADSGVPPDTLYSDPSVPKCDKVGGKIAGRIAGQEVAFDVGFSSDISAGHFEYLSASNDGNIIHPLELNFAPVNLTKGASSKLSGDKFWVPEGLPGGGRFYCITHGEFGPLPAEEQPTTANSAAFKFRIDGAYAEGDCSGGKVDVDLRGCILRNNGLIPAGAAEPVVGANAPECTPLSRRLQSDLLNNALTECADNAALTGMPNPTHFGHNQALELLHPLVPGQRYAMNLWPGKLAKTSPTVGEIWGQSTPCGPVDELLWTGAIGDGNRLCTEFVPTRAHSQLLLVTRALAFDANADLGPLRFCDNGSCGGTLSGRGAAPGAALTTVAGTYTYSYRAVLNNTWLMRVGGGGELLMVDGKGGTSFDEQPLAAAAFRMGQYEPWSDRWYCASSGTRVRDDSHSNYTVSIAGITPMPACSDKAGSDTITVQWDTMKDQVAVTSSLAGASSTGQSVRGACGLSDCDITISGAAGSMHFFVRVSGDLGPLGAATSTVTMPIADATWLKVGSDGAISLACGGISGAVMRSPHAVELQLTGVGALAACGGTPATPSTETFTLKGF